MSLFVDASVHLALSPSHYFFPEIRRRRRPQRRPSLSSSPNSSPFRPSLRIFLPPRADARGRRTDADGRWVGRRRWEVRFARWSGTGSRSGQYVGVGFRISPIADGEKAK